MYRKVINESDFEIERICQELRVKNLEELATRYTKNCIIDNQFIEIKMNDDEILISRNIEEE